MNRLKNKIGMTMAEVLIVIAILSILAGVSSVNIVERQRSMGQLERDDIAKELFVVAQNHLTEAYGEGYPGATKFGTDDYTVTGDINNMNNGIYWFTVKNGVPDANAVDIFNLILPPGSIDETVRMGSYIIKYQKDTGLILDVLYWNGSGQYSLDLSLSNYSSFKDLLNSDASSAAARKNYGAGKGIFGWYGGADAAVMATHKLSSPAIEIKNEEKLYVIVDDPNPSSIEVSPKVQLIITGRTSGCRKVIDFTSDLSGRVIQDTMATGRYYVILDDLTISGMNFADLDSDFIPGENIGVQAVVYSTNVLANMAYSSVKTTNSLFASLNKAQDTVYIGNFRHLENLDKSISDFDHNNDHSRLDITKATLSDNLSWTGDAKSFDRGIKAINLLMLPGSTPAESYSIHSYNILNGPTDAGFYKPLDLDYGLTLNGQDHVISSVKVKGGNCGLLGTADITKIENLELVDFTVNGTYNVGALAGTLTDTDVFNVLARNSSNGISATVTSAAGNAGGLIGSTSGGSIEACAASLIVRGSSNTGGLIGSSDGSVVTACYSAGHTDHTDLGGYSTTDYNITSADNGYAGGLIGKAASTNIENSYSTCSVKGNADNKTGGFIGYGSGSVSGCYCTGFVNGTNAFIGNGSPSFLGNNYYYKIINEYKNPDGTFGYKPAGNAGILALDENAASYNSFVGSTASWQFARAYDATLRKFYVGKYNLRTVDRLGYEFNGDKFYYVSIHYGDWPSPELFFVNIPD